ncbi:MAG: helix-turn-helix domain-containing protein, partial [Chloroflexi bacterium]|nr:helix-turn-helix domain-containing protein [Chloroflexota bacterium]
SIASGFAIPAESILGEVYCGRVGVKVSMELLRALGLHIAQARERARMTVQQLSQMTKLSPDALYRLEAGKTRPKVETLATIAAITELGLDYADLLKRAGYPQPSANGIDYASLNARQKLLLTLYDSVDDAGKEVLERVLRDVVDLYQAGKAAKGDPAP